MRAVQLAPGVFRIELSPVGKPVGRFPLLAPLSENSPITITALKTQQRLADAAATVQVVTPGDLAPPLSASPSLIAAIPSLSGSNSGSGSDRLFLRGIGDSPLGGFGQQSVALFLDDSRLTYDGPDPDLALVDIDHVEILEGPQGPLYGTGAMGGIVRIVPAVPDMATTHASLTEGISMSGNNGVAAAASAIVNFPLARGTTAVRITAYGDRKPGWIDNQFGPKNSNRSTLQGGRATLRWIPAERWMVDATVIGQARSIADSQYVDGNLGRYLRPVREREPTDADFYAARIAVHGKIGATDLDASTSVSRNEVDRYFAREIGQRSRPTVSDDRAYKLLDQEIRVSGGSRVSWLAGTSLLIARTDAAIGSAGSDDLLDFNRSATEFAVYGEAGTSLSPGIDARLGLRAFVNRVSDETSGAWDREQSSPSVFRLTPSATLRWKASSRLLVYARVASAYRPGGVGIGGTTPAPGEDPYRGDDLEGAEVGIRWHGASIDANATAFAAQWRNVQSDFLLDNGLIATRNIGDAANSGVEGSLSTRFQGVSLRASFILQRSRLESTASSNPSFDDRRMPIVPDAAFRVDLRQPIALAGWRGRVRAGMNWQDATRISFDPALDRQMRSRLTLDADLSLSRGDWSLVAGAANLTNNSADSFAFGNPFLVRLSPQRTPLAPRSLYFSVARNF